MYFDTDHHEGQFNVNPPQSLINAVCAGSRSGGSTQTLVVTHGSAKRPSLLEAILESPEVVIDVLSNDQVLSEIPVLGTAFKICKAVDDVRNRAFAAKLARLLQRLRP